MAATRVEVKICRSAHENLAEIAKQSDTPPEQILDQILATKREFWIKLLRTADVTGIPFRHLLDDGLEMHVDTYCRALLGQVTGKAKSA